MEISARSGWREQMYDKVNNLTALIFWITNLKIETQNINKNI